MLTWIQRAIEKYDFSEREDFIIVKNDENPERPREDYIAIVTDPKSGKRDYITTIDMAKEDLIEIEKNGR